MAGSLGVFAGIALKATTVIVLAAFSAALLRRQSAAMRHLVWLAALSTLVILPLATSVMPAWHPDLPAHQTGRGDRGSHPDHPRVEAEARET